MSRSDACVAVGAYDQCLARLLYHPPSCTLPTVPNTACIPDLVNYSEEEVEPRLAGGYDGTVGPHECYDGELGQPLLHVCRVYACPFRQRGWLHVAPDWAYSSYDSATSYCHRLHMSCGVCWCNDKPIGSGK